ncbi:MAG: ABC transporter permease [Bacillota bacterium]
MLSDNSFIPIITNFLGTDLRTATPILLAAIGLIFMARSGIVNIGAEGMMLIGALAGAAGSYYLGSAWLGLLTAMLFGGLIGLLFAYLVVTIKASQVVIGAAINILGLGLTTAFARIIFGINTAPPEISSFQIVPIPFLSQIPIIGPALFNQYILVYLTLLLVPLTYIVIYKTPIGLNIRAVGEHPKAADTLGVNVFRVRYGAIIFGSVLCGAAGAFLSLALLNFFTEDMVTGRGFIALAAVIFGKWNPLGVLGAALLFGAGDALQFRLQALDTSIPYQFFLMIPYLLTVAALAGFVGKATPPAATGKPYIKA